MDLVLTFLFSLTLISPIFISVARAGNEDGRAVWCRFVSRSFSAPIAYMIPIDPNLIDRVTGTRRFRLYGLKFSGIAPPEVFDQENRSGRYKRLRGKKLFLIQLEGVVGTEDRKKAKEFLDKHKLRYRRLP